MTILELRKKVAELGYPPQFYSIFGGVVEGTVLEKMENLGSYRVSNVERGKRYDERFFATEEAAADYMYEYLSRVARVFYQKNGKGEAV